MYYLADFASVDEQGSGAPMWTMVTGRTIPGILARGGVIGGAYGVKKYLDYKPKIRQREIYNQLTGNTLWDKTKRRIPGVKRGLVGLGSGLAVGGGVVGLGLLGKKAYDQYRERTKKWWEL
jgi:hypothetical protein